MSAKIDIEPSSIVKHPFAGRHCVAAKQALPFVETRNGQYVHRVRHVTLHLGGKDGSHFSVGCWCGMTVLISPRKSGRLVATPGEDRPMCATCEGRAIGAGLAGAREIAGRQVMFRPRQRGVA